MSSTKGLRTRRMDTERQRKAAQLEFKLQDQRLNLGIIQSDGNSRMYGEGLIEYSRLLGEWEALLTC